MVEVEVETDAPESVRVDPITGAIEVDQPDGGVVVDLNPEKPAKEEDYDANLAMDMDDAELSVIAETLLDGIGSDEDSRSEWLATRAAGMDLLGFKIETPPSDPGLSPQESLSKVRHPLLAQAVLFSQATAAGELLPSRGPVKVSNEGNRPDGDQLAEALEKDLNHYLTTTASEYYPDTRRGLFWSSFGGCVFKKVYNCPIRRRPLSETVDAKDIIVSNASTDLANAGRVTHQITMRPSLMRRMQVAEVYRDVELTQPTLDKTQVDEKEESIVGVNVNVQDRPEDQPYTVYETYCELDLDEFAPTQFKGKKIPLPYRVTLEKDSRVILEIRRNWDKDDKQCLPKKYLVKYPYVEAMGLYGIGLLHILGNTDSALTAAWRLLLDSGMINNFPGGLIDKAATKQSTNHIHVPVGALAPIDLGGRDIRAIAMAMPGKPLDAVFAQFITSVEGSGKSLGGTAEMNVGEGKQDAPVGTTLALIEQATKVMSDVHKGLHAAQAEEFQLLRDRFRDDPEAFWRHNKKCTMSWNEELFLAALEDCSIVPVADPNTPSHLHRIMKVTALKQIASTNPNMNKDEVDKEALRVIGYEDVDRFFLPPAPPNAMPDPALMMAQATLITAEAKKKDVELKPVLAAARAQVDDKKIKSSERVEAMKVASTLAIHPEAAPLVEQTIKSNAPR